MTKAQSILTYGSTREQKIRLAHENCVSEHHDCRRNISAYVFSDRSRIIVEKGNLRAA